MAPIPTPYSSYKPSGVEWLGDVPAHWEVRRLRNAIDMRVSNVDKHVKENENPVRLCNYVDVYNNDYINEQMSFMQATATAEEIERFRLEKDDVLITKDSETWDDIGVPALVTEPASDLILGYHLALLRPRVDELAGDYLLRALQSKGLAYQFHIEAKGVTRYGLSHAGIKSVWLPLPPLSEQTAIARFLDHADRRIRRYIRAKQKLLALLQEERKKATIEAIHSPNTTSQRLEVVATLIKRPIKRTSDKQYTPIGLYNRGRGIFRKETRRGSDLGDSDFFWIEEGDLVISGQFAWEGAVALASNAECGCVASHRYPILRGIPNVLDSWFLLAFFQTDYGQLLLDHHSRGAAGRNRPLNPRTLLKEKISLPPFRSQLWIAEMLQRESHAREQVGKLSKLLSEYRTRLIADVVTGKLNVREAAAALPEVDPLTADDYVDDRFDANAASKIDELDTKLEEAEA